MTTDAELDAEEAELAAKVAEAEAVVASAKKRLYAIGQERLVLHKDEHKAAYRASKTNVEALQKKLQALVSSSNDPKVLAEGSRKASNAAYELSRLFSKASAGEEHHWDSPESKAVHSLTSSVEELSDAAEAVAEYLQAAETAQGDRKKLYADTANSLRKGYCRDEGGLPCTYCGQPKWGYNDETYECRNCY